jgi:hypothetical protein
VELHRGLRRAGRASRLRAERRVTAPVPPPPRGGAGSQAPRAVRACARSSPQVTAHVVRRFRRYGRRPRRLAVCHHSCARALTPSQRHPKRSCRSNPDYP